MDLTRPHDHADTEWLTPEWLLTLVRSASDTYSIGLDPCTTGDNPCRAQVAHFTAADDGLTRGWGGYGLVYCNPPYSRLDSPRWAAKIVEEAARGIEIIALLPTRTDTEWWHLVAPAADSACFLRGRPRFTRPGGTGPRGSGKVPIAALYFGDRAKAFARVFAPHGWIPDLPKIEGTRREEGNAAIGSRSGDRCEGMGATPNPGGRAAADARSASPGTVATGVAMQGPEGIRLGPPHPTEPVSCAGPLSGASERDQQQPPASRASESGA